MLGFVICSINNRRDNEGLLIIIACIALQVMGQGARLLQSDRAALLILSEHGGTVGALSRV